DGALTVTIDASAVDTAVLGATSTVYFTVTDADGATTTATRTVNVVRAPVVTPPVSGGGSGGSAYSGGGFSAAVANTDTSAITARLSAIINILRTMIGEKERTGSTLASGITPSAPVNVPVLVRAPVRTHVATAPSGTTSKNLAAGNKTQNTASVFSSLNGVTKPIVNLGTVIKKAVAAVGSFLFNW
ncbi:MAG TPA: hypothetical protein VJ579_04095, partial [Candidatus Paceibacterota bacterium]|nr:hypothetical protein [Candidatus Paceibacterota bacterium]